MLWVDERSSHVLIGGFGNLKLPAKLFAGGVFEAFVFEAWASLIGRDRLTWAQPIGCWNAYLHDFPVVRLVGQHESLIYFRSGIHQAGVVSFLVQRPDELFSYEHVDSS